MLCNVIFPIWQVDAFASSVFEGNPAAVVAVNGRWPPDEIMQRIAMENNLSETAFVRVLEEPVPLRWFTPLQEVPLCGHATLATAAVIHEALALVSPGSVLRFATASGPLYVRVGQSDYLLEFPARPTTATSIPKAEVEKALRCTTREIWESVDRYVCVLDSEAAVRAARPDMTALSELPLPGLIITAAGQDCDFVSRYFAPAKGVPEDPVTGTSHCTLAPFWGQRLARKTLRARQLSHRGGEIECSLHGDRVHLTGACKVYLRGSITVPIRGELALPHSPTR